MNTFRTCIYIYISDISVLGSQVHEMMSQKSPHSKYRQSRVERRSTLVCFVAQEGWKRTHPANRYSKEPIVSKVCNCSGLFGLMIGHMPAILLLAQRILC